MGNPYRTNIVVGIPNDDPGHGRSVVVIVLVAIGLVWAVGLARILELCVEAVDKLRVVHVDSVVVDADADSFSGEPVVLPNTDDIYHIVHPRVSLVQRIVGVCGFGDAGCCLAKEQRTTTIIVNINTSRDEGVPIHVGIGTRSVSGTIVTTLGTETAVAVQVEFLA